MAIGNSRLNYNIGRLLKTNEVTMNFNSQTQNKLIKQINIAIKKSKKRKGFFDPLGLK